MNAPNAVTEPAPFDAVAPLRFHAMSIYPEYFKIDGKWLFAEESRMDCVPVLVNGRIEVTEPRRLKKGDQVICGRTENCEEGIYLYPDGFREGTAHHDTFAFRQGRSRESRSGRAAPARPRSREIMMRSTTCSAMRRTTAILYG